MSQNCYGLARVSRAWSVSRAGVYRFLKGTPSPAIARRPGPTGPYARDPARPGLSGAAPRYADGPAAITGGGERIDSGERVRALLCCLKGNIYGTDPLMPQAREYEDRD